MRGGQQRQPRHSISWILWSWLGAFLGIALIGFFADLLPLPFTDRIFLIGSFGASAVLLFGTPHAPFAQPRNLLLGHLVSAFAGVVAARYVPLPLVVQAALAVATAILLMHITISLHPPGGATALIAVIGSDSVRELGFMYLLTPVLAGTLLMLLVALLVNNLSMDSARHYPRHWW
jgi:CBS-domain-containing membrane protein